MNITISINGKNIISQAEPGETLLSFLRRNGFLGAKFGGCRKGECGACTVLLDGKPINSCSLLVVQASGHRIETIENIGEHPQQGWRKSEGLHALQRAFVDLGAIQCGYCTPAMILAAKNLLEKEPNPTEEDVREALSGILCRCTAYLKPVQAVMRASAILRGEIPDDEEPIALPEDWGMAPEQPKGPGLGNETVQTSTRTNVLPIILTTPQTGT